MKPNKEHHITNSFGKIWLGKNGLSYFYERNSKDWFYRTNNNIQGFWEYGQYSRFDNGFAETHLMKIENRAIPIIQEVRKELTNINNNGMFSFGNQLSSNDLKHIFKFFHTLLHRQPFIRKIAEDVFPNHNPGYESTQINDVMFLTADTKHTVGQFFNNSNLDVSFLKSQTEPLILSDTIAETGWTDEKIKKLTYILFPFDPKHMIIFHLPKYGLNFFPLGEKFNEGRLINSTKIMSADKSLLEKHIIDYHRALVKSFDQKFDQKKTREFLRAFK